MSFKLGDLIGGQLKALALPEDRCVTGKRMFKTREEARMAHAAQAGHHTQMSAFRCGYCMQIHLGHRRGRVL